MSYENGDVRRVPKKYDRSFPDRRGYHHRHLDFLCMDLAETSHVTMKTWAASAGYSPKRTALAASVCPQGQNLGSHRTAEVLT